MAAVEGGERCGGGLNWRSAWLRAPSDAELETADSSEVKATLYIGMARVGQHCSHTFGKSTFPCQ